jgi:hypothetical protein
MLVLRLFVIPGRIVEPSECGLLMDQHNVNRRVGGARNRGGLTDRLLGERRPIERN